MSDVLILLAVAVGAGIAIYVNGNHAKNDKQERHHPFLHEENDNYLDKLHKDKK